MQTYAVVGASNNKEKFGYKVTLSLKELGFNVIPINPHEDKILDLDTYPTLTDAVEDGNDIDTVVFVVPPKITEEILLEVNDLGILKVWMQPGSESKNAINYCREHEILLTYNTCIMVNYKNVKK